MLFEVPSHLNLTQILTLFNTSGTYYLHAEVFLQSDVKRLKQDQVFGAERHENRVMQEPEPESFNVFSVFPLTTFSSSRFLSLQRSQCSYSNKMCIRDSYLTSTLTVVLF